jgi:hypothetical protein
VLIEKWKWRGQKVILKYVSIPKILEKLVKISFLCQANKQYQFFSYSFCVSSILEEKVETERI